VSFANRQKIAEVLANECFPFSAKVLRLNVWAGAGVPQCMQDSS
jgi:hypothetical protein